jgi:hypothetical protein
MGCVAEVVTLVDSARTSSAWDVSNSSSLFGGSLGIDSSHDDASWVYGFRAQRHGPRVETSTASRAADLIPLGQPTAENSGKGAVHEVGTVVFTVSAQLGVLVAHGPSQLLLQASK